MSLQTWQETLVALATDGTAITNTVTPTSIFGTGVAAAAAKYTLPAGFCSTPGKMLRVFAAGRLSNVVTTPGNLTLDVRFGSTVVFNGGAIALGTNAHTNVSWWLDVVMTCRTVGAGTVATLLGMGQLTSEALGNTANIAITAMVPLSAPAPGSGFDSSVAQVVDVFATFSVANAANSLTCHEYKLVALN